ncbi:DUF4276 domain-containing protein [Actinoalloteichus sp. AHMU CJ021]|uniref:DUF4276 family protein n=1 Tax=Actinoalloteichus caeruleus DSM 43889 TaxID=1120930 RepID=A0ABT1JHU9_ACTCY|nr:DUF4276 family protein [Actinoalloteichus caeruleus]AUS78088.1 DUF4276 domain-containing protein [Actinoalloteichus sp. AHMU CJ021]MCP2332082.1 protein of unknown function (DUF4276) [Actinoalloteichus caeruleus DSM 43889]
MRPLNTAILVEGPTDETFFRVIVFRALRDIGNTGTSAGFDLAEPLTFRRRQDRPWQRFTEQVAELTPRPDLVFFHYDDKNGDERKRSWVPMLSCWETAGRGGGPGLPPLVELAPVREMEAWALADTELVNRLARRAPSAGDVFEADRLRDVERLSDPKKTLTEAMNAGRGRRRRRDVEAYLPLLAERARHTELSRVPSYDRWRRRTADKLRDLGFLR